MDVDGAFRLLHPGLREVIRRYGYRRPTPVQEKAIPLILKGYNVLVTAPTGSGKTEAALFPVMSRLVGLREGFLYAVYITPLRSLNRDIFERMVKIAADIGLRMEVRHGDTSDSDKRRFLRSPPHIAVMTPETFYFLLSVDKFREAIRYLKYIIVDEVHELVSDKRGAELSLAIERSLRWYVYGRPSIVALSATVSNPNVVISRIFNGRLVYHVDVNTPRRYRVRVLAPTNIGGVDECLQLETRAKLVVDIIRRHRSVLVFTNTRDTAEVLGALVRRLMDDSELVEVHHGSLSRSHRVSVEERFRVGRLKAVIATSSLEMGIDVGSVDAVVQFSSPRQVVKLVQRVGRASHRFGSDALGYIVASCNIFDILESAVISARAMRGNLEPLNPPDKPYDALIHQLAGISIERPGVPLEELYFLVSSVGYYANLTYDEFLELISFGEQLGLFRVRSGALYPGRRAKSYYYSTTMIPETRQYVVVDITSDSRIGVLDEEFVASIDEGERFVLAGRVWEVVRFDGQVVYVKPSQSDELIPPAWEGELIPVEYNVAREVASIFRRYVSSGGRVLDEYPLDDATRVHVANVLREVFSSETVVPSDKCIRIEHYGDTFVIYSFLGSRGNKALEYLIAGFISQVEGVNVVTSSTPYVIVVKFPTQRHPKYMEEILARLSALDDGELRGIYEDSVKSSKLYRWLLYHVAVRSGAIDVKNLETDIARVKSIISKLINTILGVEALKDFERRKGDINTALNLIRLLREGRLCVGSVSLRTPSPLTAHATSEARFTDTVARAKLASPLLAEIVKRKLARKKVCLACLNCGFRWEREIGVLGREISCPSCGSKMVFVSLRDEECKSIASVVRRRKAGSRLSRGEAGLLRRAYEVAGLVNVYGRYAVEALATRGVGLNNARRVLQKLVFSEEAFYKALVEAEATYLRYIARRKR